MAERKHPPGIGGLIALIALFALLGLPLVGYLWETLNELLSGFVDPTRLLISIPVLAVFAVLLVLLARRVQKIGAD